LKNNQEKSKDYNLLYIVIVRVITKYRIRDPINDTKVVIKIIPKSSSLDDNIIGMKKIPKKTISNN
jgi:hypothetical protein